MSRARSCCLGLIALGILLTVLDLVLVDLVSYYVGVRAAADIAGVSTTKLIRGWILGGTGPWLVVFGGHVGPVGQWGLGCIVIGLIGMVVLEVAGKSRKEGEP